MPSFAYANGAYVPLSEAGVHIEDRGYQFADGVYEVCWVSNGRIVDWGAHLDRLERSLTGLRMALPMSRAALEVVVNETLRRNRLVQGGIYLQITRGVAPRNHLFPPTAQPSVIVTVQPAAPPSEAVVAEGVRVVSTPDIRWENCNIKAVSLLPNVLSKQAAVDKGGFEAWLVSPDSHLVTEGAASNAWIIDAQGTLRTHPADRHILGGIVRETVLRLAVQLDMSLSEKGFTLEEMGTAREAFLTSTMNFVLPVTHIDDRQIAPPGPQTQRLVEAYKQHVANQGHGTGHVP